MHSYDSLKVSRFESTPRGGIKFPLVGKRILAYEPHGKDDGLDPAYHEKLQPSPDLSTAKLLQPPFHNVVPYHICCAFLKKKLIFVCPLD